MEIKARPSLEALTLPWNDYAMSVCNRRGTPSVHTLWQEGVPIRACPEIKSKKKWCSISLVIASLVVFFVVLAIAGIALYIGTLHTEPSSNTDFLSYRCSARVLRGDRFIGGLLQEKAKRYRLQLETLYQRSILGPALISCTLDKFGNDTVTVFFKLVFNKNKLSRNLANLEKNIRDILITDAIARKPVFRMIRFDPKHIEVVKIKDFVYRPKTSKKPKETKTSKGVVFKTTTRPTIKSTTTKQIDEIEINENDLPVVQGSFKISKTEADITEKKTDKTISKVRSTTTTNKPTTRKEAVTSSLYKIAAIEKLKISSTSSTTSTTTTTDTTSTFFPKSTSPINHFISSQIFNQEPWVPMISTVDESTSLPTLVFNKQPVYTSFTNPGLSYHNQNLETLGSTSLKSHPIPVNKILHVTQASVFNTVKPNPTTSFIKVDTIKYTPLDTKTTHQQEQILNNLSSIFHNLASALKIPTDLTINRPIVSTETYDLEFSEDMSLGQGQVEVVNEDEQSLILQTTKSPLVTLLPVKSNSGISRPLRKKPFKSNDTNLSIENRSFPGSTRLNDFTGFDQGEQIQTEVVTSISSEINKIKVSKNQLKNFHIMGMLNFTTEPSEEPRNPKMNQNRTNEVAVYATNSSVSSNREGSIKNFNILTPDKIKQLSEISKIYDNLTIIDKEPIISTKAISSSYTVNHSGFKILTKTLNKINGFPTDEKVNGYNIFFVNKTECGNSSIKCNDGQCLPETTKCNQLIDCNDGKDEQDCNCADYLKSQYLMRKICDGVVDCWDYSDENQCDWCKPQQYVCSNSKMCINKNKICDGISDCPQGDDERQCVTIASNVEEAKKFPYSSQGFLIVQKYGIWGKLCVENTTNFVLSIRDIGAAVCKTMTYQYLDSVKRISEKTHSPKYYELINKTEQNISYHQLAFAESKCLSKKVIEVKCQSLECGARPQAVKHIARRAYRIVGGGNAGLGSWPWQAALYKEGEFQCGATLLSDTWLVSAGHCFFHSQDEYWVARLGALRRGTTLPSPYEQLRTIIQIIVHPGYVDSGFINDISLLKMEHSVVFSDYVRPICLPQHNENLNDGRLCTVVGWGQLFEVGRIFPDTLQEVVVPIISTVECRKRTVFLPLYKITDDMFCAGYERGGRDACLGDSGGPLMCPESNGRWVLQGITSNGYGCARANRPGVYTKVANFVPWIDHQMKDNGENSTKISKSVCLGHRCPLGECLPKSRLCNGYIECSDGSDEKDC